MLITYPEARILSGSKIAIPRSDLTPQTICTTQPKQKPLERTLSNVHTSPPLHAHQRLARAGRHAQGRENKCAIMVTHDRSILPYMDTIDELTHGTLTGLDA